MKTSSLRRVRRLRSSVSAAAILAGAFAFTGEADAVVILTEDFEGDANVLGMPTYQYGSGYTLPNGLVPGGANQYAHGGNGVNGEVSSNTFQLSASPLSLTTGGITGDAIDAGTVLYDFRAQFSTYRGQNDWATVTLRFLNGANAELSAVSIGSQEFVMALETGAADPGRGWATDFLSGLVPAGARGIDLSVENTKTAGGTAIDGYVDNLSVEVNPVPEPATLTLAGAAAAALLLRRRVS